MSKISLIKADDIVIDLMPESVPRNFFPIDSAALIIGVNGSGKTKLLQDIAQSSTTRFFWTEHDTLNRRPYILYFNPIETAQFAKNTTHFQNISGHKQFNPAIQDYGMFDGAMKKSAYEIKTEPAKITRRILKIVREFIDTNSALRNYVSSGMDDDDKRKHFFRSLFGNMQEFYEASTERRLSALGALFNNMAQARLSTFEFIILFHTINSKIDDPEWQRDIIDCFGSIAKENQYPIHWESSNLYRSWQEKLQAANEITYHTEKFQYIGNSRVLISNHVGHPLFKEIFTPCEIEGSSGQKAIIRQFSSIHHAISNLKKPKNILLLIDEGDALLHVTWQAEYINSLMHFLASLKKNFSDVVESIQVVITTHSPVVASDFPKELITSLDDTIPGKVNTFATPIDVLISSCLGHKAIGEFAASKINEACNAFKHGSTDQLEYLLSITDNPIIKAGIQDMLSKSIEKPKNQG